MENLLDIELKDKNSVLVWHEFMKNRVSRDESNGFLFLSVPDILAILKQLENRLRVLVYCQRDGTPNIAEELKNKLLLSCTLRTILSSVENKKVMIFWSNSVYYTRVLSWNWNMYVFCTAMTVIFKKFASNASSVVIESKTSWTYCLSCLWLRCSVDVLTT